MRNRNFTKAESLCLEADVPVREALLQNFMLVIGLILFRSDRHRPPLFQRYAVNTFIQQNTLEGLGGFALAYLGVIAAQTIGVIFFSYQSMYVEMNVNKDLEAGGVHPSANLVLLLLQRHSGGLPPSPG